uniref:DNA/RNA non-specific endonuclease n=1 Tax=Tribolium castaneum TaxID=7070 RepID=A0A7D3T376_TRICA|nr:DNA/RNA non-specific endonuclease [Tribolium castaneum]
MYVYMFLCFFALAIDNTIASCSFNLDSNLDGKSPLVIKNNDVLLPDNELGDVELSNYDQVQLLCSGSKNNLIQYHGYLVTATCRNGKFTLPNGNSYNFKVLKCQNTPMPHAQEIGRCNAGAKLISLGFTLGETNFLEKITLCFDAQRLTTYWSRNKLRPSSYSCQIHDRGSFKIDFFNAIHSTINPDEVYLHSTFDRGHLTPRCDFFTGPEKRMTFYYINVSPQNRKLNQGNWKTLEGVIRTASKGAKRTLVIYTGTTDTRKYLKKQIPIQRYFWKVVIDANSGEGIAFIGVNSVEDVPSPCLAVDCQQIMWLGSSRLRFSNISKGAIHCCAIDNLRNIPNIELPTLSEYRGGLLRNM